MNTSKNYSLSEALRISDINMDPNKHDANTNQEEHLTYNPFADLFAKLQLEF